MRTEASLGLRERWRADEVDRGQRRRPAHMPDIRWCQRRRRKTPAVPRSGTADACVVAVTLCVSPSSSCESLSAGRGGLQEDPDGARVRSGDHGDEEDAQRSEGSAPSTWRLALSDWWTGFSKWRTSPTSWRARTKRWRRETTQGRARAKVGRDVAPTPSRGGNVAVGSGGW